MHRYMPICARQLAREAARRVLRVAGRVRPSDLDLLARGHGTDKSSREHGYTEFYERHFGPIRKTVTKVLEIGVGGTTSALGYETPRGGQSLRMWAGYFPKAEIVGVDIHAKDVAGPRIAFERGDQSDPAFLHRVVVEHGPFDIVIDDGSHIGRHITASHSALWDAVKPGGFYVIEDLAVSYHADWEGGEPGTPDTGVALLKDLLDQTVERYRQPFVPSIAEFHVYGELAILRKR